MVFSAWEELYILAKNIGIKDTILGTILGVHLFLIPSGNIVNIPYLPVCKTT